jgi:hypothetical protein
MAYNKSNVLVGYATIAIDDSILGWTSGGVQLEHSADFYNVEVDQEPDPVKTFRIKESYKIKTNLSENTLENLKIAWGIDSTIDTTTTAGYRRLAFGGSSTTEPVEHTLDIYGNAPGTPARSRRLHFFRVVAVEYGTMTIEKNKEQVIPVTFEAYADSSQVAGKRIGYFEDQTVREYTNVRCRVTVS